MQAFFDDSLRQPAALYKKTEAVGEQFKTLNIGLTTNASTHWMSKYLVQDPKTIIIPATSVEPLDIGGPGEDSSEWENVDTDIVLSQKVFTAADLEEAVIKSFNDVHSQFVNYSSSNDDMSGSTATIAILFPNHIMISHVGDSRAVLCCGTNGAAIPLTIDHTPAVAAERNRVERAGGFVGRDSQGNIDRVNGKLAVTRSLGDKNFDEKVLSHFPDTLFIKKPERIQPMNDSTVHIYSSCHRTAVTGYSDTEGQPDYDFLILASDGKLLCHHHVNI